MSFVKPHVSDYNLNKKQQAWRENLFGTWYFRREILFPFGHELRGEKKKITLLFHAAQTKKTLPFLILPWKGHLILLRF